MTHDFDHDLDALHAAFAVWSMPDARPCDRALLDVADVAVRRYVERVAPAVSSEVTGYQFATVGKLRSLEERLCGAGSTAKGEE